MKTKKIWLAAVLIISLLWLSGCGSGGSGAKPSSAPADSSSAKQSSTAGTGDNKLGPVKVTLAGRGEILQRERINQID